MEELIKITEQDGRQAVSARELHQFLDSKQEFANWIKNRIDKYGFVEGQDFCSFDNSIKRETGATIRKEYAISIDMAKELCMIENNERGKQARRYFIACEKKARNPFGVPSSFREALLLAAKQQEQIEAQRKLIEANAPRVLFSQAVETSNKSVLIGELAKILCQNGVPNMGERRLFQWLRDNDYLCSKGERYNQPTQKAMEMKLFEIKKTVINKPNGVSLVTSTTKATPKAQIYFVNKFLGGGDKQNTIVC
jgi:anti-repressor protein